MVWQLKSFWEVSPRKLGKNITHFHDHIFQMGWFNHQLVDDVDVPGNQDLQVGLPYMVSLQTCQFTVC